MPNFYIAATPTPLGKRWDAFAAIRLSSMGVRGTGASEELAGLGKFYLRHVDLLQSLWRENSDVAFELRYHVVPDKGGRPGRVVAAIRARASAGERAAAVNEVKNAVQGLLPLLSALSNVHYWTPVSSHADYREAFPATRFRHSAEVVRQRLRVQVVRDGDARGDGRFCPTPTAASRGSVSQAQSTWLPLVRPFNPRLDSWERLFVTLLSGTKPIVLSVAVAPTRLGEGEAAWLREAAVLCESTTLSDQVPGASFVRASAHAAVAQILESQRVLSDKAFLLRVQVASTTPLLPGVAEVVGTAISDAADAPEMRAPVLQEAKLVRGGFAVIRPAGAEQVAVALRNLSRVGFDLCGPSAFPSEARRLERLAGSGEAAAAFRLPAPLAARFPGLPSEGARIVDCQVEAETDGVLLGMGWMRGRRTPVYLDIEARRRHIYVVGKTGMGKTTFLYNMVMQDIAAGRGGVCVLDPHGDLTARVYADLPEARRKQVVFVDFSDEKTEHGFNILEKCGPGERDRSVNMVMEAFNELYDMKECGGPMFEMYMRAILLISMSAPGIPTLLDAQKVLCDKVFRDACLVTSDGVVRSAWQDVIVEARGEASLSNIKPYVLAKLTRFLHNSMVRRIVCREKSTLDFAAAMAQRQVVLVNLGKGALGQTNSAFLGMLLSGQLLAAALARPSGQDGLADFSVYVDEFQNFTTPSFATMLPEVRKYQVNLVLANQHLGQLRKDVGQAVLGNVGSVVAFKTGPADAEVLAGYMAPQFTSSDLMGLSIGRACASLLMGGGKAEPFTLEVCPASHSAPKDSYGKWGEARLETAHRGRILPG